MPPRFSTRFDAPFPPCYNPAMNEHLARLQARYHLDRAQAHNVAGEPGYALAECRRSLAHFPTAEAHLALAAVLGMLGRHEEAIGECEQAIALDPDRGQGYQALGHHLVELDRWADAHPWFALALSAPDYDARHRANFDLGRVHDHFGRLTHARDCYRAALALDPTFAHAADALARIRGAMN